MSMPEDDLMIDCPIISDAAPVVVGGIGGSGTRVFAQILQQFSFDMGTDLNSSLDDLGFTVLFKRPSLWPASNHIQQLGEALQAYLFARGQATSPKISEKEHEDTIDSLIAATQSNGEWIDKGSLEGRRRFLCTAAQPKTLWGWKEPNTHIQLPFFLAALPNMKYIHVTRHGLDMAYSNNQTQLKLWGEKLLNRKVNTDSAEDSLAFWCATHDRMLRLQKIATQRILILRFESLFESPNDSLTTLRNFLEPSQAMVRQAWSSLDFTQPKSLGRYKQRPPLTATAQQQQIFNNLGYQI